MSEVDAAALIARAGGRVGAVLDVGAFVGAFSLGPAADHPDVRFVAVEPVPELAARLRTAAADLANYAIVEAAVDSDSGERQLMVPADGAYDFSSLLPMHEDRPDFQSVRLDVPLTVAVRRLDEVVREHCPTDELVVKIDVQGNDLMALESLGAEVRRVRAGMIETAVRTRHRLYADSPNRRATVHTLRRLGFEVVAVDPVHPSNHEQDLVFVRRDLGGPRPRLAYPLLIARAWARYVPARLRAHIAVRTRLRRLLQRK